MVTVNRNTGGENGEGFNANPSFIRTLKQAVNEDPDYLKQIAYYKKNYPSVYDLEFLQQNMFVILVSFAKEHKQMLAHCKEMLEYRNGQVAINPRFNKLITALRTAEVTLNLTSKIFGRSNNVIPPILH